MSGCSTKLRDRLRDAVCSIGGSASEAEVQLGPALLDDGVVVGVV